MGSTHLHFHIISYESYDARQDKYINPISFNIIDISKENALARVRVMIPENRVKLMEVVEHFDNFPCGE